MKAVDIVVSLLEPAAPQAGESASKDTSAHKQFDALLAEAVDGDASTGKGEKAASAGKQARPGLPGRAQAAKPGMASARGAELPTERAEALPEEGATAVALSSRARADELPTSARSFHNSISQSMTPLARGRASAKSATPRAVDAGLGQALEQAVVAPAQAFVQDSGTADAEPSLEEVEPTLPSVREAAAALAAVLESVAQVVARIVAPAPSAAAALPTSPTDAALSELAAAPRAQGARNLAAMGAAGAPSASAPHAATAWSALSPARERVTADGVVASEPAPRTVAAAGDVPALPLAVESSTAVPGANTPNVESGFDAGRGPAVSVAAGTTSAALRAPTQGVAGEPLELSAGQSQVLPMAAPGSRATSPEAVQGAPVGAPRSPLSPARSGAVAVSGERPAGTRADVSSSTPVPAPAAIIGQPAGTTTGASVAGATAAASAHSPNVEATAPSATGPVALGTSAASLPATQPSAMGGLSAAASAPLVGNAAPASVASGTPRPALAEGPAGAEASVSTTLAKDARRDPKQVIANEAQATSRAFPAATPAAATSAAPTPAAPTPAAPTPAAPTSAALTSAATTSAATRSAASPAVATRAAATPPVTTLGTAVPSAAVAPAAAPAAQTSTALSPADPASPRPVATPSAAAAGAATPAASPLAATVGVPLPVPAGELMAAQNQTVPGAASNGGDGLASPGQRSSGQAADETIAPLRGFTRGALVGQAMSAYGGRSQDSADQQSTRSRFSEEREPRTEASKAADVFGVVDPSALTAQHQPTPDAPLLPSAGPQPAVPLAPAQPALELPTVEFAARPPASQSENASISLHHPDLGPIRLEVQRIQGRIEVHAVIESVHAEAVLRANESGIRQGVQQSGMTFSALRVRVRGDEPNTARAAQARRRRANERET